MATKDKSMIRVWMGIETPNFLSLVKGRRQRLKLIKIQNTHGVWLEESKDIEEYPEEAVSFY